VISHRSRSAADVTRREIRARVRSRAPVGSGTALLGAHANLHFPPILIIKDKQTNSPVTFDSSNVTRASAKLLRRLFKSLSAWRCGCPRLFLPLALLFS